MFNRDQHRSPSQKAQRALMNIISRLAGCGFLVYFIIKLMMVPKEEAPGMATATILGIIMIGLAAVVIVITVIDALRGIKTGRFSASTYEDEDLAEYLAQREASTSACDCADEQSAPDTHKDDAAVAAGEEKDSEDQ